MGLLFEEAGLQMVTRAIESVLGFKNFSGTLFLQIVDARKFLLYGSWLLSSKGRRL